VLQLHRYKHLISENHHLNASPLVLISSQNIQESFRDRLVIIATHSYLRAEVERERGSTRNATADPSSKRVCVGCTIG